MFDAIFKVFEAYSKFMAQNPNAARALYYGSRKWWH
jgi:hypothetical protein